MVAVNIPPRGLMDPALPRLVLDTLEAHGVAARRLCLELTETLALSQLETVDRVLGRLSDIGVQLTLDGFGTGTSYLQLLSRIPVHWLKIDSGIIDLLRDDPGPQTDRQTDPDAQARDLVRSVAELGRALGLPLSPTASRPTTNAADGGG